MIRIFSFLLTLAACSSPFIQMDTTGPADGSALFSQWPPQPFTETLEIQPNTLASGDVVVIRAAVFVNMLDDDYGSFVFTPTWNGELLSHSQVLLEKPEFDHVFTEWIVHIKESGQNGNALAYGTVTVTDVNQGTVIRGAFSWIAIDTTQPQQVGFGIGKISGPGSIDAELLSLTVSQ